ncbi:MAG: hypothetical protein K1X75_12360 [Leptospirales bacterium]|nr:hypothetical protein [Leptospirales bacterium]
MHQIYIDELKQLVADMAARALEVYDLALDALESRRPEDVSAVLQLDKQVDALEMRIDEKCVEILGVREPFAQQFRYVFSAIRMANELERVGDESRTVARWALKLKGAASEELRTLSKRAREALELAVYAINRADSAAAERVMQLEFEVDELEDHIIESQPPLADAFIAKAMERIGDLATNLAEAELFFVHASDVRHGNF